MDNPKVKSVYKAILILEEFMCDDTYLGVSQIAESLSLPKSTVSNILSVFQSRGFVEKDPRSGKYKLGIKALELSNHTYQSNDVRRILQPYMQDLSRYSMENVFLATYNQGEVVYIGAVNAEQSTFSGRMMIGVRAPAYCTGIGKAILSQLGDDELERVIQNGLVRYTERTITDPLELKKEMEIIRQRGYAIDNMEHEYGVECVAVPIKNQSEETVAGLSISGPSLRMSDDNIYNYSGRLLSVAQEVKRLLI